MSKFLTPVSADLIDDVESEYRGLWRLDAPLVYQSDLLGRTVTVPAGFVTDLESCPRVPVAFMLFGAMGNSAAIIHDWLYTFPTQTDRATADAVLKEALIASGIPAWRAFSIWLGVRMGGSGHFGEMAKAK